MKAGTVLLIRTRGVFGRAIRRATGSAWNHACMVVAEAPSLIVEARPPRVRAGLLSERWAGCRAIAITPKGRHVGLDIRARRFANDRVGDWYGLLQVLGYLPVLRGVRKHNPIRDGVTCFELAWWWFHDVLEDSQIRHLDRNACTAVDLLRFAESRPAFYAVEEITCLT